MGLKCLLFLDRPLDFTLVNIVGVLNYFFFFGWTNIVWSQDVKHSTSFWSFCSSSKQTVDVCCCFECVWIDTWFQIFLNDMRPHAGNEELLFREFQNSSSIYMLCTPCYNSNLSGLDSHFDLLGYYFGAQRDESLCGKDKQFRVCLVGVI